MITRLQTTYNSHRADSGRLSSGMEDSDPGKVKAKKQQQMHNVPRKIRDMFVAEPGYVFVAADYAAIDWCVMMWYASRLPRSNGFHAALLRRFRNKKMDPHAFLASVFYERSEGLITKPQRQTMKPYTYGYWQNAISVGRRVGHLDSMARRIGEAHEQAFRMHEVRAWMLSEVKKKKYCDTALGFRRYWWEWNPKPEEVFAHYGQGTAADIFKWILLKILAAYKHEVITHTHDNVVTQVPEAETDSAARSLQEITEQPIPFMDDLSWRVDVKTGLNWRSVS